ncbi:MAG: NAD-dependent epimerase/dehydratase family protein [Candidatus Merdousia sp.]|nr:NAD-dependent epimerase/dehydratase family protein [Candidatus Merdousia sp.]
MKILVTGAKGFVGKNILLRLKQEGYEDVVPFDIDTSVEVLDAAVKDCDFVLHFAGVNRPKDASEFMSGNFGFTTELLGKLEAANNKATFLITSSIQAALDNPYGKSKKAAEDYIFEYAKRTGAKAFVYRLPNVFGKWCRPNYNSAIATFCNNIARDLPITVNDPNVNMHVVYIDDIADEIVRALKGNPTRGDGAEIDEKFCMVPITHHAKLGEIVEMIRSFKQSRGNLEIADMTVGSLSTKLYSTYLSYLPEDDFSYPLNMHVDERGSFTEFMRTIDRGQVSVNITKPHITKGNHWHHSKNEKYIVVKGRASIRFRKVGDDKVIEYLADGETLKVVDIPTGYVHCIENIGEGDLVTIMWANEPFNPDKPDTYFEKV